jgi:hypothetical protein
MSVFVLQAAEDRGQKTEVGGQRSEDRSQKTEVRGQIAEKIVLGLEPIASPAPTKSSIPAEAEFPLRSDQHPVSSIQHRPGKSDFLTSTKHEELKILMHPSGKVHGRPYFRRKIDVFSLNAGVASCQSGYKS